MNGVFISSNIDPYAENFKDNSDYIEDKLRSRQIPSYRIHASGHAKPHDIYNYVKEINPEFLIPVHTEYPRMFEKLFKNKGINVLTSENNLEPFQVEF